MRAVIKAITICALVAELLPCILSAQVVKVSSQDVEWVHCTNPYGLKLTLRIVLRNESDAPITTGKIGSAKERLYNRTEQYGLKLINTTATPDEFSPADILDNKTDEIREQIIPAGSDATFTIVHYTYVPPVAITRGRPNSEILASFEVTNVRKDGKHSSYWSEPSSIKIPLTCKVK